MVLTTIAGIFIVAIVCGVGLGVASADSADDVAMAGAFGFDKSTNQATSSQKNESKGFASSTRYLEQSTLASTSERTLDSGMKMIDDVEQAERDRKAALDATVLERVEAGKEKQGVASAAPRAAEPSAVEPGAVELRVAEPPRELSEEPPAPQAEGEEISERTEYGLPAVDWTVGREAFMDEWTARIDAYLEGSPLAGYGKVFAEAAWENGVDPRWSPAISNTESGKGTSCFLPHNAWGWGASSWSDWDHAIREHVAGLAKGYGYSVTPEAAAAYCPPNSAAWYQKTHDQMATI